MAAIPETGVVVFALVVGVPEIDDGAAERAAVPGQHKAGKFDRTAAGAGVAEVAALRRSGFEKWSLGLTDGRLVAIATGRGRRQFLRQDGIRRGKFQPERERAGVKQKPAAGGF